MELLELMKLDMTNFTIEQLRPHLQQQSVEYERTKFKEFLETQSSKFISLFLLYSFAHNFEPHFLGMNGIFLYGKI